MKVEREYLVPYLNDICALYYAEDKINHDIEKHLAEKVRLEKKGIGLPEPKYEEPDDTLSFSVCMLSVLMLTTICIGVGLVNTMRVLIVFGIIVFVVGLLFLIQLGLKIVAENKEIDKRNKARKEAFEIRRDEIILERRNQIACVVAEKEKLEAELRKVRALRSKAYEANVIPSRYRDQYTAVYLYDWFSTSLSDNIEWALQMYVLEEIKSKLDTIIQNQAQMILNQRIMIANQNMMLRNQEEIKENQRRSADNQRRILEQQEYYSAEAMKKLDRIAASNDERNMYLAMLGANSAIDAYFSAADFLRYR